jgi:hypothetical protein
MYLSITKPPQNKKTKKNTKSILFKRQVRDSTTQLHKTKKNTKKNFKAKSVSRAGEKDIISRPNLCATLLRGIMWRARFYTLKL